jgi:hypothetical protein
MEMFDKEDVPESSLLTSFSATLRARLAAAAKDPNVAGFKSVVCYRTGLDVSATPNPVSESTALSAACGHFEPGRNAPLRLADKPLNDLVVRTTLEVAAEHNKPGKAPFVFLAAPAYFQCPFAPPPPPQCSSTQVLATRTSR